MDRPLAQQWGISHQLCAPDVLFQRMWKGSPLVSELLGATARVSALIANSCRLSMVHTLMERTGIDSEPQSLVLRMPRETPCSQTDLKSAHSCCLFLVVKGSCIRNQPMPRNPFKKNQLCWDMLCIAKFNYFIYFNLILFSLGGGYTTITILIFGKTLM